MSTIGTIIQHERKKRGLSQLRLALMVDTSQSVISNLENGKRATDARLVRDIGRALNLDIDVIVAHAEEYCDAVEVAIIQTSMSLKHQDLLLAVYGYLSGRDSVNNAGYLRMLLTSENHGDNSDVQNGV